MSRIAGSVYGPRRAIPPPGGCPRRVRRRRAGPPEARPSLPRLASARARLAPLLARNLASARAVGCWKSQATFTSRPQFDARAGWPPGWPGATGRPGRTRRRRAATVSAPRTCCQTAGDGLFQVRLPAVRPARPVVGRVSGPRGARSGRSCRSRCGASGPGTRRPTGSSRQAASPGGASLTSAADGAGPVRARRGRPGAGCRPAAPVPRRRLRGLRGWVSRALSTSAGCTRCPLILNSVSARPRKRSCPSVADADQVAGAVGAGASGSALSGAKRAAVRWSAAPVADGQGVAQQVQFAVDRRGTGAGQRQSDGDVSRGEGRGRGGRRRWRPRWPRSGRRCSGARPRCRPPCASGRPARAGPPRRR